MNTTKVKDGICLKTIHKICCCLLSALFLFIVFQKIYTVIAYDTPKELREMNTIIFAHQFAYGKNPYSLSALESEIPPATSIYGLLVPLLMSPFIRFLAFTSLNSLQICELITLIVEVIGTFSFYRLIRRKTMDPLLAVTGMLLFYSCYWRYTANAGAFPDQWGLSLSVILADLLYLDERKRHFRPGIYTICLICLFYIKQYFVLCAVGLCIYLLIHSRKDLVKFVLYGGSAGCVSIIMVHIIFPLYFSETFPIAQGQTLTGSSAYSYAQIAVLSAYYSLIVIFSAIGILITAYCIFRHKSLQNPLPYELCQIVFILPFLLRIAENQGTNYTYYLQLWYPYIILYGISSAALFRELILSYGRKTQNPTLNISSSILVYIMLVLSVIKVHPSFQCDFMTHEQQESWNTSYNILKQYSADGEILVSMLLSEYCLENQINTSNYGQAEYNNTENLEKYKKNKLWRNIFFFDHTEALLQKNISYNRTVREKLYNQSYTCIAVVYAGEYHLAEDDFINAGYHILTTEDLMAGSQCWHTVFYVTVQP